MNWYKIVKFADGLWEDIEEYGPGGSSVPIEYDINTYKEENPDWTEEDIKVLITKIRSGTDPRMSSHKRRLDFTSNYGWSIPSKQSVDLIKQFVGTGSVIEVGSGYGLWAKLLSESGVNVKATDTFAENVHTPKKHRYTEVENLGNEEAMEKYGDSDVLMMSWPPYDDPMAYKTISNFRGHKFIYIGEGYGGCTGSDDFHDALHREWEVVDDICIPQWSGIHDSVVLYQRQ